MSVLAIRSTCRSLLAAYLLVYLCVLVPAHSVLFTCHDSPPRPVSNTNQFDTGTSDDHGHRHDPERCQICLHGGQVHTLVITASALPILPVDRYEQTSLFCPHELPAVHRIASRAPPVC